MATRGRDLERTLGTLLTLHIAQIGHRRCVAFQAGLGTAQHLQAFKVVDERKQMRRGQDIDIFAGPGGFCAAGCGANETLAHCVGANGCGQGAGHGGNRTIERKLADGGKARDGVGRDRIHGDHHRQHDWQIELAAFLGQVGRR